MVYVRFYLPVFLFCSKLCHVSPLYALHSCLNIAKLLHCIFPAFLAALCARQTNPVLIYSTSKSICAILGFCPLYFPCSPLGKRNLADFEDDEAGGNGWVLYSPNGVAQVHHGNLFDSKSTETEDAWPISEMGMEGIAKPKKNQYLVAQGNCTNDTFVISTAIKYLRAKAVMQIPLVEVARRCKGRLVKCMYDTAHSSDQESCSSYNGGSSNGGDAATECVVHCLILAIALEAGNSAELYSELLQLSKPAGAALGSGSLGCTNHPGGLGCNQPPDGPSDAEQKTVQANIARPKRRVKAGDWRTSSFFHVAIDCPGYGRTKGDCQTIRSYPGDFLSEIVRSLGKRRAFCLVGSSQGCCSTFNAALENPSLTRYIAVKHPVGHDVTRYGRITQPSLLIYDTNDTGHPVKVGRQAKRFLKHAMYVEHSSATHADFHENFMGTFMLHLFNHFNIQNLTEKAAKANSSKLPLLAKLAGGFNAWCQASGHESTDLMAEEWPHYLQRAKGCGDTL